MKRWAVLALGLCACARQAEPLPSLEPLAGPVSVEVAPPLEVSPGPLPGPADALPAVPTIVTSRVIFDPVGSTSIEDVRNVVFEVDVSGAHAGAELALELTANQTVDYQRLAVTLDLGPSVTQHQSFVLPVAGTMIRTNQLSGSWNASFRVDTVELSSQAFGLAP